MFSPMPLFPSDRQIAEALYGKDKARIEAFLSRIPHLEANDGFPAKSLVYGNRYWPAVKAYLDAKLGLRGANVPDAEDVMIEWQDVPDRRKKRA